MCPRILEFADGFTSSTAPVLAGSSSQEDFTISNNVIGTSVFTIDSAAYKSAFFDYDLKRVDTGGTYIQEGKGIMGFDGTDWTITFGNYQGDDMVVESSPLAEQVYFYMTTSTGVGTLKYDSGTMGGSYAGEFSMSITRIIV